MEKLRELIHIFEASDLSEIEIEEEGRRMRLKKARPRQYSAEPIAIETGRLERPAAMVVRDQPDARKAAEAPKDEDDNLVTIDSPMVGVFYVSPSPGDPPFVRPGDAVSENQTVCIVEAMKLMNEVTAKFPGVVEKVLVQNGEPVEYGQPLFAVRPLD